MAEGTVMSEDAMALLWIITAIWIGLPLHVIAGRLTFICKQIKDRP